MTIFYYSISIVCVSRYWPKWNSPSSLASYEWSNQISDRCWSIRFTFLLLIIWIVFGTEHIHFDLDWYVLEEIVYFSHQYCSYYC